LDCARRTAGNANVAVPMVAVVRNVRRCMGDLLDELRGCGGKCAR
jgi:hypothetical protein